ncbi:AAA family ATPase [Bacillus sp. 1NLA3E]|uniref:AAA family ATPase n=1 Tax=Bacillus sp. 1NLA3E TaxID=666686 RepID=UPI000247E490|nr:AAA family ATPase [Bacillus sp. 1NLA3E]AGK55956.1 response regulator receiver protein [Bacillus sp. 1NLA3E]
MQINYLVFSSKVSFGTEIAEMLHGKRHIVKTITTETDLKKELEASAPSIIIIGQFQHKNPYEVAREFSLKYRNTVVLLMLPADQIDLKQALYSGVVDILPQHCTKQDFLTSIEKVEQTLALKLDGAASQPLATHQKDGKIIVFLSTKGGVGKTTLAVNAATALAKKNLAVAVIDLDLQFGDVPLLFDKEPKATIYDWVKESLDSNDGQVEPYMMKHQSGVEFIAAPPLPEFAELISGDHVSRLIEELKKRYDVVIIDTPPSLVETNLVALDHADDILLITSLDLPALKNGKLALDTMTLLGFTDKIKIVLNRDAEMKGMNFESIEGVLGKKVFARIPSDYMTVISSINKGVPFVISAPRTQVAKATLKFAESLVTIPKVPSEKSKKTKRFKGLSFKKSSKS